MIDFIKSIFREDPPFELVSQSAHIWFGMAIALIAGIFHVPWWGFGVLVLFAGFKESWWDLHYESVEVQGSKWLDFGTMVFGGVIGLAISLWRLK